MFLSNKWYSLENKELKITIMKSNTLYTKVMKAALIPSCLLAVSLLSSCESFLDDQVPQATLSDEEVSKAAYVDNMVTSAYAIFTTAEDINSSFSMWNYDVRSDDAYKGGSTTNDGDVFHQLEVGQGILTTNWNINDMWVRLYNAISRVNDKNIPFVMSTSLTREDYNNLSNTEYSNDAGWAIIAQELEEAYKVLPVKQADKGRPTKAAAAAFLTKVYLYKAYRQDDANSNQITSINQDDLEKVLEYSNPSIYTSAGYGLETDIHNNFRPEDQYENGC